MQTSTNMTHGQIVEKVLEAIQAGEKNPVREYEVQDYLKAISYALLGLLERGEDNSRDILPNNPGWMS